MYHTNITPRKNWLFCLNFNVTVCVWYLFFNVAKVSMLSGCQFVTFPCHAHLLFDGDFNYSNYDYLCSLMEILLP